MSKSVTARFESILGILEHEGPYAALLSEVNTLARSHPEAISLLAKEVMRRFTKGGTYLDAALSFMPQELWPELVQDAMSELEKHNKPNDAAESVIEYASLQCPSALHPHLDRIFQIRPNADAYYEEYPWRESGDSHFHYLRNVIEDPSQAIDDRRRAFSALCETRNPQLVQYAISCATEIVPSNWSLEPWIQAHTHRVGFDTNNIELRRLTSDSSYHLIFPDHFFVADDDSWQERIHPTWNLPCSEVVVNFGGSSSTTCSLCGSNLHRLLRFDSIPTGIEITQLPSLEIATCLSCLGWERQPLFYLHAFDGTLSNIGYEGIRVYPEFVSEPLRECVANLAGTPHRWSRQDWACGNGRENLNRIGGEPSWIQDAEYPACPVCQVTMSFLFQLDSELTQSNGGQWYWGSGGIAYGFWCDTCKVSGMLWQCT